MKVMNYKPINKGNLLGVFSLSFILDKAHEGSELTVHDLKLFEKNGQRWVGFPSRSFQSKEGDTKYAPYVSAQKELESKIKAECLRQLGPLALATSDPVKAAASVNDMDDIPF